MQTGIMIFDEIEQYWKIWIGQEAFEAFMGMEFEICIQARFYQATFTIDYFDWFITIEDNVDFSLRLVETYKVKIQEKELVPAMDLPF